MTWISKYTFTLNHPVAGSRVVNPVISNLQKTYEKDKDQGFHRSNIATELLLVGADYDWILAIENGADRCEKIDLLIEVDSAGSTQTFAEGYISLNDADFDIDNCRVSLPVRQEDEYTCLFENWEEEYDVIGPFSTVEVKGLVGELEFQTCTGSIAAPGVSLPPLGNLADPAYLDDSCLANPADGWTLYSNFLVITNTTDPQPGPFYGTTQTVWVREKYVDPSAPYTAPSGPGWIQIAIDTWVRSVPLSYDPDNSDITESVDGLETLTAKIQYQVVSEQDYDNGLRLEDVLETLIGGNCGLTVKSEFFRINSTAYPATAPYTAAAAGFDEIVIFQKSDIVRPDVSQNATILTLSLRELLEQLQRVFNTRFRVEDNGTTLRIEHVSYFAGSNGLDFTAAHYSTYTTRRNSYNYQSPNIPARERFDWMDDSSVFFDGVDIIYSSACAGQEQRVEIIAADRVTTDIGQIRADEDNISLEGMVFAACYVTGSVYTWNLDDGYVNGHLAYTNLHDNYWTYDRPLLNGNMNGADVTFDSAKRYKWQEALNVKLPVSEVLTLNPGDYIKTGLGWGEIESATWNAATCQFEVQLSFEI